MVGLLKMREQIFRFAGKYERYVLAVIRFAIALAVFELIVHKLGTLPVLSGIPLPLIGAAISAFLPAGVMMFIAALLMLAGVYSFSMIMCAMLALIFVVLFFAYFRFTSGKGLYAMITALLSFAGIPYVMPVAAGLISGPYAVISVICGQFLFYVGKGIIENQSLFAEGAAAVSQTGQVNYILTQILGNPEIYFSIAAAIAACLLTYCISRLSADHSRMIAMSIAAIVQMIIVCAGEFYLGNLGDFVRVIVCSLISYVILLAVLFLSKPLDYSRVEYLQFEDDDYLYYVKAVPKVTVSRQEKQVKTIRGEDKGAIPEKHQAAARPTMEQPKQAARPTAHGSAHPTERRNARPTEHRNARPLTRPKDASEDDWDYHE